MLRKQVARPPTNTVVEVVNISSNYRPVIGVRKNVSRNQLYAVPGVHAVVGHFTEGYDWLVAITSLAYVEKVCDRIRGLKEIEEV